MTKYILCYSGGKDSTAMLIHLLENQKPIDEILYVDVGDWVWESSKEHLQKVKDTFNVEITSIDITDELRKGFERWGFPSFLNRWCTGIKREVMRKYLREKYGERERALYNTLVTVQMKSREHQRNFIQVMMLNIHLLMQI